MVFPKCIAHFYSYKEVQFIGVPVDVYACSWKSSCQAACQVVCCVNNCHSWKQYYIDVRSVACALCTRDKTMMKRKEMK